MMEAAAPRAGATAIEEGGAKPFRWPRMPMPVVIAVLGLVLGSWLIPAFTRQWDDRQKAAELKALVVADIASATGKALLAAQEASTSPGGTSSVRGTVPAAGKEWAVANLEIRARLRAYFGDAAVEHWTLVSQYVTSTLSVAYRGPAGDALIPNPWVSLTLTSPRLEQLFGEYLSGEEVFESLEMAILSESERFTSSLLAMHIDVYSTTLQDFVGDLVP